MTMPVAEVNNGGDMVEATLRMVDPNIPFTGVDASRGKVVRAEPAAALYEQQRVHHVGMFPELEDQMCGFTTDFDRQRAGYSPDRVDALVWALSDLLTTSPPLRALHTLADGCGRRGQAVFCNRCQRFLPNAKNYPTGLVRRASAAQGCIFSGLTSIRGSNENALHLQLRLKGRP
jgi:hypothetical protein